MVKGQKFDMGKLTQFGRNCAGQLIAVQPQCGKLVHLAQFRWDHAA